jgi:hypothetical protein
MMTDDIAKFLAINPKALTKVQPEPLADEVFECISGAMTPKECYSNALSAAITLEANAVIIGATVINSLGFPVEHAWVEMSGGVHVDPTMQVLHGPGYIDQHSYFSLYRVPRIDYFKLAKELSHGKKVFAIDMMALRRNPGTRHLFKIENPKRMCDAIKSLTRDKGDAQENS